MSCGYARPLDKMPVEVTHLHSSLEGATPTEVLSLFRLMVSEVQTRLSLRTAIYVHAGTQVGVPTCITDALLASSLVPIQQASLEPLSWKIEKLEKRSFAIRISHTQTHACNSPSDSGFSWIFLLFLISSSQRLKILSCIVQLVHSQTLREKRNDMK